MEPEQVGLVQQRIEEGLVYVWNHIAYGQMNPSLLLRRSCGGGDCDGAGGGGGGDGGACVRACVRACVFWCVKVPASR